MRDWDTHFELALELNNVKTEAVLDGIGDDV